MKKSWIFLCLFLLMQELAVLGKEKIVDKIIFKNQVDRNMAMKTGVRRNFKVIYDYVYRRLRLF